LGLPPVHEVFGTTVIKHCCVAVPSVGLVMVYTLRLLSKFVLPQRESVVFCAKAGIAAAQARNINVIFAVFIFVPLNVFSF
jgi:hypothetical protein